MIEILFQILNFTWELVSLNLWQNEDAILINTINRFDNLRNTFQNNNLNPEQAVPEIEVINIDPFSQILNKYRTHTLLLDSDLCELENNAVFQFEKNIKILLENGDKKLNLESSDTLDEVFKTITFITESLEKKFCFDYTNQLNNITSLMNCNSSLEENIIYKDLESIISKNNNIMGKESDFLKIKNNEILMNKFNLYQYRYDKPRDYDKKQDFKNGLDIINSILKDTRFK